MKNFPRWLSTETNVRQIFQLYGFRTEQISILGRQIDLVAERTDTFNVENEKWIIEITLERVGVDKGSKDSQKLLLAQKQHPKSRLMLITLSGFTDDQEATLRELGIMPLTYAQFEERQINLSQYALHMRKQFEKPPSPDVGYNQESFVEPMLRIKRRDDTEADLLATIWQKDILCAEEPRICALLGDLGSGKTSLLQHVVFEGCQCFLENPNENVLPIYVPLGRYKQHSGDIEQMLMTEFKKAGQTTYPNSLVMQMLSTRRAVLLLDGLDEVHPIHNSDDVLETVATILNSIGQEVSAVISCRRQFFQSTAEELAYFGSYTSQSLAQLNKGISRILRGHPTTYIASVQPFDRDRINEYFKKTCQMSEADVDNLFDRFYGFKELATTPVFLAMIATTVKEKLVEPKNLGEFPLLALFDAYTNRWLERDSGRAKLSSSQRREFSESLADHMLWSEKESASWAELKEVLRSCDSWNSRPIPDEQAELDIRKSGFLVRDMDDRFRFIHRSIMEYFSARKECGRLISGARVRYFPTDGFRLFLMQHMAKHLVETEGRFFPPMSWDAGRGNNALAAQVSMLLAASTEAKSGLKISGINNGIIANNQAVTCSLVSFENSAYKYESGEIIFKNCKFIRTSFSDCNANLRFVDCEFEGTKLLFSSFPEYDKPSFGLDAATTTLQLPSGVLELARLLDGGAQVNVGGKEWKLTAREIISFADAFSRIKEKVRRDNFAKGTKRGALVKLLKVLQRLGYVSEDTSRNAHILSLEKKAFQLIGKFKTDPLDAQIEMHNLVVEGGLFPEKTT